MTPDLANYLACVSVGQPPGPGDFRAAVRLAGTSRSLAALLPLLATVEYLRRQDAGAGTARAAAWAAVLLDVTGAVGQAQRRRGNAARDAWAARQRDRGRTWEQIHEQLGRIAPGRGWAVPADPRALSEAYRRHLRREHLQRRAGVALRGLTDPCTGP